MTVYVDGPAPDRKPAPDRPVTLADLTEMREQLDQLVAITTELLALARQAAPLMRLAENPAVRFARAVTGRG